ncbi:MAG: outer membrane lipoprotein-sorting protein [Deltaproteobacteria bacterium]|nr:outer membrane lipoprotein-sorting protein [Candidatus Anaeroferrophillus wilburensis]MBN2887819.1 outer membrane lipoprotein-sorting protein [Deltaproteobacteria bacterium]
MKRGIFSIVLIWLLVASLGVTAPANEELSVTDIVERANLAAYYAGADGRATVQMTITDAQGRERQREFAILRYDVKDGGEQKFYVYFNKPADVRKMVYLVHKYLDRDDDRWLYLPALDLVKRIAASDKRTSFVGSHFLYEDVSGRSITEDTHELLETTEQHYVLKNIPKDPETVEFSSYVVWIDRQTFMPMKAEYRDKEAQPYRVVEALEVRDIQGYPTVVKSRVRDLTGGGQTVSEFSEIKYDVGLKEQIFTERYLRRPPREVR